MIHLEHLWRTYQVGDQPVHAVRDVTMTIEKGEHLALTGPSGSGKSTLLHVIGCLDRPTRGSYYFNGKDVGTFAEKERSRLRRYEIGFVFQFFHLLPRLTALGNVELPMLFAGFSREERRESATGALDAVGLSHRIHHKPDQLSGGERQRVAIARAVVMNPSIILADEPTGNLDSKSAVEIMEVLESMNAQGLTLVVVTHDATIARRARRIMRLKDGALAGEVKRAQGPAE